MGCRRTSLRGGVAEPAEMGRLALVEVGRPQRQACGIVRKHAGHRWEVTDIAVDDAEQRDDRGLVGGDRIEIAHGLELIARLATMSTAATNCGLTQFWRNISD